MKRLAEITKIATTGGCESVEVLFRFGVWIVHRDHTAEGPFKPAVITHAPTGRQLATVWSVQSAIAAAALLEPQWGSGLRLAEKPNGKPVGVESMLSMLRDDCVVYTTPGRSLGRALDEVGIEIGEVP